MVMDDLEPTPNLPFDHHGDKRFKTVRAAYRETQSKSWQQVDERVVAEKITNRKRARTVSRIDTKIS